MCVCVRRFLRRSKVSQGGLQDEEVAGGEAGTEAGVVAWQTEVGNAVADSRDTLAGPGRYVPDQFWLLRICMCSGKIPHV